MKNMLGTLLMQQDGVNKRCLEAVNVHDYLLKPMTFELNMNRYRVINLRDTAGLTFDSAAVNKKYVNEFTHF